MLDCESASKLTIPAFRVAVARRLIKDYGLSQGRVAALMGVRQASISKYLSSSHSGGIGATATYISSKGLEKEVVRMALSGTKKAAISLALERAATDPILLRHVLSTKGLQIVKKSKPQTV